ncbi:MAG: hypothetical protein A3F78_21000 [Burkholderiales bacterium RIFCSPLOWO2_12_FULL_61_40]|nr:MAG: hypothetical protein A3F78_21000 [Burkholderiales bacterium RIFCSPLOWO2_12_FULL_61_40]
MMEVALAIEDELSKAIGLRLLAELPTPVTPNHILHKGGSGYLKSRMDSWREMSQRQIVFLLTDLDRISCPVALRADWLGKAPQPANLLLRIAVREVESWVLADHIAMRKLIGNKGALPPQPDDLPDPKQHLLKLAKLAPRPVRQDLVKEAGAIACQGIGYNTLLSHWVQSDWSPARAAERSPSLARTRQRLRELQ